MDRSGRSFPSGDALHRSLRLLACLPMSLCPRAPVHPRVADARDVPAWLLLAREFEGLFGPMSDVPAFQEGLRQAIRNGQAFCLGGAQDGEAGGLLGGVLVSDASNAIAWLAVSSSSRGSGLGQALLEHAISHLDPSRPISVQTFASEVPEGVPARRLYSKLGFIDAGPREPTPAGIPTVLMVRPPSRRA